MRRISFYAPSGPVTPEKVSVVLALIDLQVPAELMAHWSDLELLLAYDYAMRHHLRASDNPVRLRPLPAGLMARLGAQ